MRRRRAAVGATVAALSLALTACSGLPHSGPVQQGYEVGAPVIPPVRLRFEAPAPGAEPEQIVSGFLAASWSAEDDYAAARAYLTSSASRGWTPRQQVLVYPSQSSVSVERTSDTSVRITVEVAAHLDSSGRYTPTSRTGTADLTMEQVEGQWRIAALPQGFGLWLSHFYFERAYRPFDVTYADASSRALVADRRWFSTSGGLTTALARAQLEPVPPYLAEVVESGFPAGTQLAVDSVPLNGGVAEIELARSALDATAEQRRAAWAQMLTTLRQVPGVRRVALRVDGRPLAVLGAQTEPGSVEDLGYSPVSMPPVTMLVQRSGARLTPVPLSTWLGRDERSVDAPPLPQVPDVWTHTASTSDVGHTAAISTDRTRLQLWAGTEPRIVPGLGSTLTPPGFDQRGRLWVSGVEGGTARISWLATAEPGSTPRQVQAPWLRGRTVLAAKPSFGGRRLAVASVDASGVARVDVTGVVLQDGLPAQLTRPWTVAVDIADVRDLAWLDDRILGVLGRQGAGAVRPVVVPLGGQAESLTGLSDPTQIMSVGGARGLVVVTADGTVMRRVGTGWQSRGQVTELVIPGT